MAATLVDVHTHLYPPKYMSLLESRSQIPYVRRPDTTGLSQTEPARLIILPSDDDPEVPIERRGRPVDSSFTDIAEKINFMDKHGIDVSVISLANPWLDWVDASEAKSAAELVNDEFQALCAESRGRLFFFATLPVSGSEEVVIAEIKRLQELSFCRGIVLGTTGRGKGLDMPDMMPIWQMIGQSALPCFIHPHYGLPMEVFGEQVQKSGHVLPLSLGFPLETTIAFVRMYLAGVFDRCPNLKVLLAHAGGAVPFLAGRVDSCVKHERVLHDPDGRLREGKSIWDVLKHNVWLDAVGYSTISVRAAIDAVGPDRVLFGTDHAFFPPISAQDKADGSVWRSVETVKNSITEACRGLHADTSRLLAQNAVDLLRLPTS